MSEPNEKKDRPFIREKIVPKKKTKRVILLIVLTVVLAVLFGAAAGVTFFISQNVLGKPNAVTEPAPEVFSRDDPGNFDETEEAPSGGEDILDPVETESAEESAEPEETTEEETAPPSIKSIYEAVKSSIVRVTMMQSAGEDWFGAEIVSHRETFGIAVMETDSALFILLDARDALPGAEVEVAVNSTVYETTLFLTDQETGLGIVRLPKSMLKRPIQVASLGNSEVLTNSEPVFLAGTPFGHYIALDEGRVISVGAVEGVLDGFRQRYYTNMAREQGGSAVIFNENAEVVGWVSDYAAGDSPVAIFAGISSLKYIIEDLCLNRDTAYLGVRCRSISTAEAAPYNVQPGLYVSETVEESPAFIAGIQQGDRIVRINAQSVSNVRALQMFLDRAQPGDTVEIEVARGVGENAQVLSLTATLGARP